MKIAALLCFFREDPEMLSDTIRSLQMAKVSSLVALDGRYAHFPSEHTNSTNAELCAIRCASKESGITASIHQPDSPWPTEMDKRTAMFRLAEETDADWWVVLDADEPIVMCPDDLHERLEETEHDAGIVVSLEGQSIVWGATMGNGWPHVLRGRKCAIRRCFFRAIPGIEVLGKHWRYMTPDGREIWGPDCDVKPLEIPDFIIDHRNGQRDPQRAKDAQSYYAERDRLGIETTQLVA